MTRRTLSRLELSWARSIYDTIFPPAPSLGLPNGIVGCGFDTWIVDLRSRMPAATAFGIRLLIWVVALLPIVLLGKLRTIASLPRADRERVFQKLAASRLYLARQIVLVFKSTGGLLYAGHPSVRERIYGAPASTGGAPSQLVRLRAKSSEAAA